MNKELLNGIKQIYTLKMDGWTLLPMFVVEDFGINIS